MSERPLRDRLLEITGYLVAHGCASFVPVLHETADTIDRLTRERDEARAGALEEAKTAVKLSAWRHVGSDAFSQGMDNGARRQLDECLKAVAALPHRWRALRYSKGQDTKMIPAALSASIQESEDE